MSPANKPNSKQAFSAMARILGWRFIQRRDVYARQLENGAYVSIRKPLHNNHLIAHLQDRITPGTYVLDANSAGRFLVIDADDEPAWQDGCNSNTAELAARWIFG